jgi:hypothetical protein
LKDYKLKARIKEKKKKTDQKIANSKLGFHCLTIELIDNAASSRRFVSDPLLVHGHQGVVIFSCLNSRPSWPLVVEPKRFGGERERGFGLWRRNMIQTSERER